MRPRSSLRAARTDRSPPATCARGCRRSRISPSPAAGSRRAVSIRPSSLRSPHRRRKGSSSAQAPVRSSPSSSWPGGPSPKVSSIPSSTTVRAGGTRSGAPRSTRASRARWPRSRPRCPPSAPAPSTAIADAAVHDLYPVLVDQIARDRLRADRVRLAPSKAGRANAIDHLLEGLTAPDSALPRHSGLGALERQALRVGRRGARDAGRGPSGGSASISTSALPLGPGDEPRLVLELWLQASDDPDARPARVAALGPRRRRLRVPTCRRPAP